MPKPSVTKLPMSEVAASSPVLCAELCDEAATARFGHALAHHLSPGDTVLLSGEVGAGKSTLVRALIRARLGNPMAEVPSPSYTLVNIYAAGHGEIWHIDLYRLDDPDGLVELGIADALGHAIVLVEWPERWPDAPQDALRITLKAGTTGRMLTLDAPAPRLCQLKAALTS